MRRLLASIALAALLAVAAGPAFAAGSGMPCCRGGPGMACCLPGPGCAMKACPAPEPAAALVGLPPAVVEAGFTVGSAPESGVFAAARVPSPRRLALSPPELPPRA